MNIEIFLTTIRAREGIVLVRLKFVVGIFVMNMDMVDEVVDEVLRFFADQAVVGFPMKLVVVTFQVPISGEMNSAQTAHWTVIFLRVVDLFTISTCFKDQKIYINF
jgi:hypothetical protein